MMMSLRCASNPNIPLTAQEVAVSLYFGAWNSRIHWPLIGEECTQSGQLQRTQNTLQQAVKQLLRLKSDQEQ